MKKTTKLLALLLALSLVLCGCGNDQSVSGEVTPKTEPAATESAPTEPAPTEKAFSIGRVEGGTYTNTYFGIGCELDENWSFYTAEELQELPEDVQGMLEGSDLSQQVDLGSQVFDLGAENVEALLAVNVVYSKISMQERLIYGVQTEEQTIDMTLAQSDLIIQSYTQAGMEIESMEKVKVMFLGEEHYAMRTVAQSQGVPIYMVQIMRYDLGAYGATLTATSYMEDNTQVILDMFYAVE